MSRKARDPGIPGWLKVVVCLAVTTGGAAGAGHVVDGPATQPTTACVGLQTVLAGRVFIARCTVRANGPELTGSGPIQLFRRRLAPSQVREFYLLYVIRGTVIQTWHSLLATRRKTAKSEKPEKPEKAANLTEPTEPTEATEAASR